eukprot:403331929
MDPANQLGTSPSHVYIKPTFDEFGRKIYTTELSPHNVVWWYFQVSMLIPSFILVIYYMWTLFSFKNTIYEESQMREEYILEIRKKQDSSISKFTILRGSWRDHFWRMYVVVASWYYINDIYYIINHYDIIEEKCMLGMVIHHVATLHGSLFAVFIQYYPWFFTLPWAFHCLLITWPYFKILHVPYVASLLYMLYRLFTEPFRHTKLFRGVITCLPLLTVGLLYISLNNCDTNDLKY